jgi:Crp-like helix-turn-helix domain
LLIDDNLQGEMEARASQSDIAEIANLGRSKVNASLKALEGRGMIRRGCASIEVTDAPALRTLFATGWPRTLRHTPRFAWRVRRRAQRCFPGTCRYICGAFLTPR